MTMVGSGLGRQWFAVAAAAAVVAGAGFQFATAGDGGHASSNAAPWAVPASGAPRLALGVTTDALAKNEWRPWTAADLGEVNAFEQNAQAHVPVVMWFADWKQAFEPAQAAAVAARGSVPEITWEPWDHTVGLRKPQPAYRLAKIAAGRHDAYIRGWALALKRYGRPVRLRFAHEMNGRAYPWGEAVYGNRRGEYVRAYRHVHDIFTAAGVKNVTWVWSPLSRDIPAALYPGGRYVDVVGLSAFNGGTALPWGGWQSFATLFAPGLRSAHRLAPRKPVEISEVGSAEAGGSKAAWIAAMFAYVRRHPEIEQLTWFDVVKQADWRVESSRSSQRAFARGARRLR